MSAPRFPQPFLEALLQFAAWKDVRALVSVDTREAPGRRWFITARCTMILSGLKEDTPLAQSALWADSYVIKKFPGMRVDYVSEEWDCPDGVTGFAIKGGHSPLGYQVPKSVTKMAIESLALDVIKWPPKLKYLYLGNLVYFYVNSLPFSVDSIEFGKEFNLGTGGLVWPRNLRSLKFSRTYTGTIDVAELPETLEDLTLSFRPCNGLRSLPRNLKRLRIETSGLLLRRDLPNAIWPPGLIQLELGGPGPYTVPGDFRDLGFDVPKSVTLLRIHVSYVRLVPPRSGLIVEPFEYESSGGCGYWPPWVNDREVF
jgi:hypothetical protein